ncbi:hypothetical protein D9613_009951 [Agrocybe pediades]|uniref:DUF5648 domain-containing protein n=1 Tax=Agrocybe pediades TaxID=84607 RepID=A0A8H4QWU2_9AGAR|nr:hypothetical protein D9613_009951 [Agrocybe pediades]
MKLNLKTLLCSLYLLAAKSLAATVDVETRDALGVAAPQAYGDPRLLVPFFRLWNPALKDDFYTVSVNEKNNAIANLGYK